MSAQVIARGTCSMRSWRIVRAREGLRLHLWTPLVDRAVLCVFTGAVALPALALWSNALDRPRISTSVTATIYSLVVVFAVVGMVRRCGAERVTVDASGMCVERFDLLLLRWRTETLEVLEGAEVSSSSGPVVELVRALAIDSGGRHVRFGTWLSKQQAARIREHLRAALTTGGCDFDVADGVVRRVATRGGWGVPRGAEGLIVLERRRPGVVGGTLRKEGPTAGLGELLYLFAVLAAVVWVIVAYGSGTAWSVLAALLLAGAVVGRGGVLAALRRRRVARVLAESPDEPWRAVSVWDAGVIECAPLPRLGGLVLGAAVFGGIALLVAVSVPWPPPLPAGVALGVLGLFALAPIVRAQNVAFQGTTEARLREMPYRTPGTVVVDFAVAARGASFDTIRFTLQRVVELRRRGRRTVVGCSHVGTYVPPLEHAVVDPGGQVEARFVLPPDARGTILTGAAPAFWELVVEGQTSCGWYSESFPIPIYDAPEGDPSGSTVA